MSNAKQRWSDWAGRTLNPQAQAIGADASAYIAELEAEGQRIDADWVRRCQLLQDDRAEAEAVRWKSRQRSTEQKLGYEEKLRGKAEAERDAEHEALARAEAKVKELEAELASPWHVGAFIEVDGITVGPHKAREWLRRIRELEDKLAALRADLTEILDSAWNTAHKRAGQAEATNSARVSSWSAFQDYRDDGGKMTDFDAWLSCHINCGKEMRAP